MSLNPIARKQLPVDDDMNLHKKGWWVQRVGWVLMYVFLLLALLGFFGEGPLSKKNLQAGNIKVQYERFGRYEHGTHLVFESGGTHISTVSLPQDYLKNFRLDKAVPTESRQVTSAGYVNFIFEGTHNSIITFYLVPVQRKSVEVVCKVNGHSFIIKQTIYP